MLDIVYDKLTWHKFLYSAFLRREEMSGSFWDLTCDWSWHVCAKIRWIWCCPLSLIITIYLGHIFTVTTSPWTVCNHRLTCTTRHIARASYHECWVLIFRIVLKSIKDLQQNASCDSLIYCLAGTSDVGCWTWDYFQHIVLHTIFASQSMPHFQTGQEFLQSYDSFFLCAADNNRDYILEILMQIQPSERGVSFISNASFHYLLPALLLASMGNDILTALGALWTAHLDSSS